MISLNAIVTTYCFKKSKRNLPTNAIQRKKK